MQTNTTSIHAEVNGHHSEASKSNVSTGIIITAANKEQKSTVSAASQTTMTNSVFEKTVYEKIMEKIARREQRR